MELLIGLLIIAGVGYYTYNSINKKIEEKSSGSNPEPWPFPTSRPLEGDADKAPYKIEPPERTTKIDGIGHESVEVKPKKKAPAKKATTAKKAAPAKTKAVKEPKPKKTKKAQ